MVYTQENTNGLFIPDGIFYSVFVNKQPLNIGKPSETPFGIAMDEHSNKKF